MPADDLLFVIPTRRPREVAETVEQYDEHFHQNGHSVRMIVFDDSSPVSHEKYYQCLEQTATYNELYYVGPREKADLLVHINGRLHDNRLAALVKGTFRPSYGGNRNCTLIYTLGSLMVSADDDMRPYTLMEHCPSPLGTDEICRGRLHSVGQNSYRRKSFDILSAFLAVLGKRVGEAPDSYERGESLMSTPMRRTSISSDTLVGENSLLLRPGPVADDAVVKLAQTFRSGCNDCNTIANVEMFLDEEGLHASLAPTTGFEYVLVNFRPAVTKTNCRTDCGVSAYDNTSGLPPFFPTRLRFEDYIYRLWLQQKDIAAAHVNAAQNHTKSNYMRRPAAAEMFNEELSEFLFRKIKASVTGLGEFGIAFDYDGEVTAQDADSILDKFVRLSGRAEEAAAAATSPERALALRLFAADLQRTFYGFEPDFFQQNLLRIADEVVSLIKGSIELWPTLLEICYFQKIRKGLPQIRVKNRRK